MSYAVKDEFKGLTIHTSKKGETVCITLDSKVKQSDLKWLYEVKQNPCVVKVKEEKSS